MNSVADLQSQLNRYFFKKRIDTFSKMNRYFFKKELLLFKN